VITFFFYEIILLMIYGFFNAMVYSAKVLLLLFAYCYFKHYGGLTVQVEEAVKDIDIYTFDLNSA